MSPPRKVSRVGHASSHLLLFLLLLHPFALPRLVAHNAPGSALLLDFHSDQLAAELRLPLSELELAFRAPLVAEPATVVSRHRDALAAYLRRHLALLAPDGRPWTITVGEQRVALAEQPFDLVVALRFTPPPGAPLRRFTLRSDAIAHEVINHIALVFVCGDWDHALLGGQPELLGALRSFSTELVIDRTAGSPWRGFRASVSLGLHHIREGTDHLLFLLVLLLPAPLVAENRRWRTFGGARRSFSRLLKIVTAFTVGHSLTLIAATFGWLHVPSAPVEVLVAASILVSAFHALRPIFPGRETWIAAGFGLVHGLAFATVIAGFHLGPTQTALALLGFNLGIELMQLLVVALTMPWLILLSRTAAHKPIRIGGSILAAFISVGWIAERALDLPNPLGPSVEHLAHHALWIVAALALLALVFRKPLATPSGPPKPPGLLLWTRTHL